MRELSLNVMDAAQNCITAGAGRIEIEVREDTHARTMDILISDDGCGMSAEQLAQVQSPFYTTRSTRSVGLGIPLFKMASELTGGTFSIRSAPGEGTALHAQFRTGHIDMTPLGEMGETILLLITCNPALDFVYRHALDGASFTVDTADLRGILGEDVPLDSPDVAAWLREYLREQERELKKSQR